MSLCFKANSSFTLTLPLAFGTTRRRAEVLSSPTTNATVPVSSGVVMVRINRCRRPRQVIWFISFFCRGLEPSHHTPSLTSSWLSSQVNSASSPAVTVTSLSAATIRTRSVEEEEAVYGWRFRDGDGMKCIHNNMDDKHSFFRVRHGATVLEELMGL